MKLSDFILLNEDDKTLTVLHQGILIAKRIYMDSMVFLFQMESYYVEAYCNCESKEISGFMVFESVKPLNPYLDAIRIDDLLT